MADYRINDIVSAIKDPQFIKDSLLNKARLNYLTGGLRVEMYAGGFSQVFPMVINGVKYANKIWYNEIENNRDRYKKIDAHLKKCKLPYFLDFTYTEEGLLANGIFLDTLRMEWVVGSTLKEYISSHLRDGEVLSKLADTFLKMVDDLHKNGISHGDLHHDNIFITADGQIKLIDYDSICVPELEGEKDICRGRPTFQHPMRMMNGHLASTKMDYFSELTIYLSILALQENPILWESHNVDYYENRLLFKEEDIISFYSSQLRIDLNSLSLKIQQLVLLMDQYLSSHLTLKPIV